MYSAEIIKLRNLSPNWLTDSSGKFTDRLYVPDPKLTVPRGTVINLNPNKSELGSGWAIDKYDWQIFPPIDPVNGFE